MNNFFSGTDPAGTDLDAQLASAANGLIYISETDSDFTPFAGTQAASVTADELVKQLGLAADAPVQEISPDTFFSPLVTPHDWDGEAGKVTAAKFTVLRDLLKANLTDLHVYRFGKIRIDIYIAGLDSGGRLTGIRTKAVET